MISASFFRNARSKARPDPVARLLHALGVVAIPALLSVLVMRFLVPRPAPRLAFPLGLLARVGQAAPVLLGVVLFLFFSAVARYWRLRLTAGSYVSREPPPGHETVAISTRARNKTRETAVTLVAIALAVGAATLLRARIAEPYRVLTGSMLPTLQPGDYALANKVAYGTTKPGHNPRRGEIIGFPSAAVALQMEDAPRLLIKRIIGLPGDRIQMRGGLAIVNGWTVPTCDVGEYLYLLPDGQGGALHARLVVEFLENQAYLTTHAPSKPFTETYEVKPAEVFVLGDNRGNSLDSRGWNDGRGGGVPFGAIEGRVQWFLVGTHLDGAADWQYAGVSLLGTTPRLRVEGIDASSLRDGIAKCMKQWPPETHPPTPGRENDVSLTAPLRGESL